MRLIDADALIDKVETARKKAKTLTGMDFVMVTKDMPTIDAIPVEWIMKWSNKRYRETQRDVSIIDVLEAWQKEQEAKI